MQFHGGVYRSDDAGESWTDIGGGGLPSDFGFPLMVDPADPDSAYVIPLVADMDRVTPDGRVRVYETRDGGSSWTARGDGLPAEHAYLTVLRQAFSRAGTGRAPPAVLRRHLRRCVRLGRRRRHLVRPSRRGCRRCSRWSPSSEHGTEGLHDDRPIDEVLATRDDIVRDVRVPYRRGSTPADPGVSCRCRRDRAVT